MDVDHIYSCVDPGLVNEVKIFGVLQAMSLFILLGIGADDVFILTDALYAEPVEDERTQRLGRAFGQAFATMLTTSLTTAAAFGIITW